MGPSTNHRTVAQNRHRIADGKNLFDLVAHEKKGNAFLLQCAHDLEKMSDLASGERSGRFVHDDDARLIGQRASNGNELFRGHGQKLDRGIGVDLHLHALQCLDGQAAAGAAPVHDIARCDRCEKADILPDAQIGKQRKVLIDDRKTGCDGAHGVVPQLATVQRNLASIRTHHAREDLDQRRFAGTVFTSEAPHLSLAQFQIGVFQYAHRPVGLANVPHLQDGRAGVRFVVHGKISVVQAMPPGKLARRRLDREARRQLPVLISGPQTGSMRLSFPVTSTRYDQKS